MNRRELKAQVLDRIGDRRLVWFGTRGDDVESLTDLGVLSASFSIIGRYQRRSAVHGLAMEDLSGVRVDLDAYDIDDEPDRRAFEEFRRAALRALSTPSTVVTYRPSALVSALGFARSDRVLQLGMFRDQQFAFEHKPWVESAVRSIGIPSIPWTYVADEDHFSSLPLLDSGPLILRRSRTSGGSGLVRVDCRDELERSWFDEPEGFVSVAPYLSDGVPINVSAVVWDDGITLHPASLQLIGIPQCTTRPFGYCGNDFGAFNQLDPAVIAQVGCSTTMIGEWLRRSGYRGTFGVDYLLVDGQLLFTEVNPRFQGSTHLSCQLSVELDEGCLLLDHLAALLGVPAPPSRSLEWYACAGDAAHIVLHHVGAGERRIDGHGVVSMLSRLVSFERSDVVVALDVTSQPGATIARLTTRGQLTTTGFDLPDEWSAAITSATSPPSGGAADDIDETVGARGST